MLHSGSRRIGNHTAQTYDKIARKQTEQRGEGDQVVCRACGRTATALSALTSADVTHPCPGTTWSQLAAGGE